jgi:hypothetical protein
MKKSFPAFVAIALLLSILIACSKKKDSGPGDVPAVNNPNPNPDAKPNDSIATPPPVFTDFFPASAFIGDTITFTGENLDTNITALTIRFGDVNATVVSASKTAIKAIVPDEIVQAKVNIELISGGKSLTSGKTFNLKAPLIESISHKSGFEGQTIKITGKGFRSSYKFDQVSLGDKIIPKGSTIPGTGTLTIHVPSNVQAGKYPIAVSIAGLTTYAADSFTIIVPVIKTVSPDGGTLAAELTITGENFVDANGGSTTVILSNLQTGNVYAALFISPKTNNELKVILPQMATGTYTLSVRVLGSYVTFHKTFTYTVP